MENSGSLFGGNLLNYNATISIKAENISDSSQSQSLCFHTYASHVRNLQYGDKEMEHRAVKRNGTELKTLN